MVGKVVGDYTIVAPLGSGAAGTAYRARHNESGDEVALKLIHAKHAGDVELQNRFVREVAVLEKLRHEHVVAHRDCGVCDDGIYLAMELVDSGSLSEVLRSRVKLPWRDAAEVGVQVCDALEHAHAHGVIHRDLKPQNLFLSSAGKVKIGDFGLARDNEAHRLTMEGKTVGTRNYMAPEQIRGEAELSGAVDLYALGCLMFEMIVGRTPYSAPTAIEMLEQHLFAAPPKLASLVAGVPAPLSDLVERLMAKEPAERGASAGEVGVHLRAILAGEELPTPEQSDASSDTPMAPEPNLTQRLKAPAPATEAKKPNVVALVVLAIIGAIVIAAIALNK
jgi:serine/threonine protein kinase